MDVELGTLPDWLSIGVTAGFGGSAILAKRRQRATDFAEQVQAAAGMMAEPVAERLLEDEALLEVVAQAIEAAARTTSGEHRALLARVVAAGLTMSVRSASAS